MNLLPQTEPKHTDNLGQVNVSQQRGEEKSDDNNQGCTSFPKILKPPENSRHQRGDLKLVPYCEQKFSCHTALTPMTCAPLMMTMMIVTKMTTVIIIAIICPNQLCSTPSLLSNRHSSTIGCSMVVSMQCQLQHMWHYLNSSTYVRYGVNYAKRKICISHSTTAIKLKTHKSFICQICISHGIYYEDTTTVMLPTLIHMCQHST